MDKYLKLMPSSVILVLSIKCIALGTTFADVSFLAVLSCLVSYFHFATKEKRVESIEKRQTELENSFQQKSKEIDEVKNHLSGMKLATTIRSSSGRF